MTRQFFLHMSLARSVARRHTHSFVDMINTPCIYQQHIRITTTATLVFYYFFFAMTSINLTKIKKIVKHILIIKYAYSINLYMVFIYVTFGPSLCSSSSTVWRACINVALFSFGNVRPYEYTYFFFLI